MDKTRIDLAGHLSEFLAGVVIGLIVFAGILEVVL